MHGTNSIKEPDWPRTSTGSVPDTCTGCDGKKCTVCRRPPAEQNNPTGIDCSFCAAHCQGDILFQQVKNAAMSIQTFDPVRLNYCPICGKILKTRQKND